MQGTFSAGTSLESWGASVATNENATMLRDTSAHVTDVDTFGNVLRVNVATAGVDLSYETTRIVKNDTTSSHAIAAAYDGNHSIGTLITKPSHVFVLWRGLAG